MQVPIVLRRLKCLKEITDLNAPAIQNFGKFSAKSSSKSASRHVRYSSGKSQRKKDEEGTPSSSRVKQGDQPMRKAWQASLGSSQETSQGSSQGSTQESGQGSSQRSSQRSLTGLQGSSLVSSQEASQGSSEVLMQETYPMSSQRSSQRSLTGLQGSSLGASSQEPMSCESNDISMRIEDNFSNGGKDEKKGHSEMKETLKEGQKGDQKMEINVELNEGKILSIVFALQAAFNACQSMPKIPILREKLSKSYLK